MVDTKSYQQWCDEFSWNDEFARTDWNSTEELNVAHECCDRWADTDKVMFHWAGADGERETWTYGEVSNQSNRVANALSGLGVDRGDRVATLLTRTPELITTQYGVWKMGATCVPLFTAFGPAAIEHRLDDADVAYLVTSPAFRDVLDEVDHDLEEIVVVDRDDTGTVRNEDVAFDRVVGNASSDFDVVRTDPLEDTATIMYTSGTTGQPKGELWPHRFVLTVIHYMEYAWGVEEDSVVFCGADPAWGVGQAAITGPSILGASFLLFEDEFDPIAYFELFEEFEVEIFAHAPTAYRGLMAAGEAIDQFDIDLEAANALGESTPSSVIEYFEDTLDVTVHDGYGFTEAAMLINNYNKIDMEIKPGSMGLPSPGWDVDIIDDDGNRLGPNEEGEIAVRNDSGIFLTREYLNLPEKTAQVMESEWRRSGDLGTKDEDGYYWFQGRKDDVIVSAGYKIGPEEVEDAVLRHDAVANVGVIGVPDEERGEIVKAVVVPADGATPSQELKDEIKQTVRTDLAKHAYPREVEFVDELPMTHSGKIRRVALREREGVE